MSYQKRILGQQLGAYVYLDPRIVIANHDLAEVSGTLWTTGYNTLVSTPTLSNLNIVWENNAGAQSVFWGDGTGDETINSGVNISKTWSTQLSPNFTNAEITHTTNKYMSGNYVRGSSNFYAKLI